jgi:hypothetical protein
MSWACAIPLFRPLWTVPVRIYYQRIAARQVLSAYAAGGGVGRHSCTPARGAAPWNPKGMRLQSACQLQMPPLQHNAIACSMRGGTIALG